MSIACRNDAVTLAWKQSIENSLPRHACEVCMTTTWVCEVALRATPAAAEAAWHWFGANFAKPWSELPDLAALDVYRPAREAAHDPFNDDKDGPLLLVVPEFHSVGGLIGARSRVERDLKHLPEGITATVTGL